MPQIVNNINKYVYIYIYIQILYIYIYSNIYLYHQNTNPFVRIDVCVFMFGSCGIA